MERSWRAAAVCGVAVGALAAPAPAAAHLRTGTVAVDRHATVLAVPAGVTLRIYQSDRGLRLAARPGHAVTVLGYLGEPMLRIDAAGVGVDLASPSAAAAGLVPRGASARGAPVWRVRPGRAVVWHDARVQSLGSGTWRIPAVVDGRHVVLLGRIVRLPRPAAWPWALLAVLVLAAAAIAAQARRREWVLAFGGAAALLSVLTAAVFALDQYASPGIWIAGADEIVFALVGAGALVWGNRHVSAAAAVGLGLLAIAVGASKGEVFVRGEVLAVLAGTAARVLVTASLAVGVGAVAVGGLALAAASRSSLSVRGR